MANIVADIVKKYGETGSTQVLRQDVGRPRKISPRMQRSLVRICKVGRRVDCLLTERQKKRRLAWA